MSDTKALAQLRELAEKLDIADFFKTFFYEYQGGRLHHDGETYFRFADLEAYVQVRVATLLEAAEKRERELETAFGKLLNWLDDDTLEIMRDTLRMGITFDWDDCSRMREQIELARAVLYETQDGAVPPEAASIENTTATTNRREERGISPPEVASLAAERERVIEECARLMDSLPAHPDQDVCHVCAEDGAAAIRALASQEKP